MLPERLVDLPWGPITSKSHRLGQSGMAFHHLWIIPGDGATLPTLRVACSTPFNELPGRALLSLLTLFMSSSLLLVNEWSLFFKQCITFAG